MRDGTAARRIALTALSFTGYVAAGLGLGLAVTWAGVTYVTLGERLSLEVNLLGGASLTVYVWLRLRAWDR